MPRKWPAKIPNRKSDLVILESKNPKSDFRFGFFRARFWGHFLGSFWACFVCSFWAVPLGRSRCPGVVVLVLPCACPCAGCVALAVCRCLCGFFRCAPGLCCPRVLLVLRVVLAVALVRAVFCFRVVLTFLLLCFVFVGSGVWGLDSDDLVKELNLAHSVV